MTPLNITQLLLLNAFLLSSIAAYYSIAGLVAIFAAAPIPIIVMGSILEVSKIVITSWVYRNWSTAARILKYYFVGAIIVLMFLTSMGIFGFLSKAHSDQNLVSGDVQAKLAVFDEKIKTEKENIDANRKIITQLDLQVNETISRTGATDTTGRSVDRSIAIRRGQAKERQAAQEAILSSQSKISKLNEERAPIAAEVRQVEAEVGPIKYIAQLIYGQEATGQDTLEQAVRWVIILIVAVFDPLAVGMFIAYNQTAYRKEQETVSHDIQTEEIVNNEIHEPDPEPIPKPTHVKMKKPRKKKVEWEEDRVLIPLGEDPDSIS